MYECKACGCECANAAKCEICGLVRVDEAVEQATKRYTAFNTFQEFCETMAKGYTPTIHPNNTYRGRAVKGRVRLIEAVRAAGYKVYDGTKVA